MSDAYVSNKIVVLDFSDSTLLDNKVFNPDLAKRVSHTILPTCLLYEEALKRGIQFITSDVFIRAGGKIKNAVLMSHLTTSNTDKIVELGAKPVILTCQESPFIATRFYVGLKKYSSRFKYSFLFSG